MAPNRAEIAAYVSKSTGFTPKSIGCINRVNPHAAAKPIAIP
jgi:hypothetical protein